MARVMPLATRNIEYVLVVLESEAHAGQAHTLLTDTQFGKTTHILATSLYANSRNLEVEKYSVISIFFGIDRFFVF